MNAYLRIEEYNDTYTTTEKLIADYILQNDILQDSAQVLGEKTNTSAAAIIRFSKKIGFKGFSDLKMNLAQSTKEEKQQEVDPLEASIDLLNNASTIYLFGVGGSSVIGLDIYQKLMRIGKKVIYNSDLHVQMTFAQSMDKNDAALIISYSGSTTGLVDVARVLHDKQIPFISITQINSNPISKLSTYSLKVPSEEKALRIGAVSSRISSFVITDLLYYGVFKKNFEEHKKNLIDSKDNVSILKK